MRFTLIVLAGSMILVSSAVHAHHGYTAFDIDRLMTVEGNVEEVLFQNPHSILKVRTKDGELYTVEWQAATSLKRSGITMFTVKAGDHIIATGNPMKDPAARIIARTQTVSRPSDGWVWPIQSRK